MSENIYEIMPDRKVEFMGGWRVESHNTNPDDTKKKLPALPEYEVVAYNDLGEEIGKNTGCLGNKALEFWFGYQEERAYKLAILTEDYHKERCIVINTDGKQGHEKEYEEARKKMLLIDKWIREFQGGRK